MSHPAPRNLISGAATLGAATVLDALEEPMVLAVPTDARQLAGAFTAFIAAASQLEASYSELQGQVAELSVELAERNQALNASLAENERMRLALQQIVDTMPCGVLVVETDGALTMINPEGLRLLELDGQRLANPHLSAISEAAGLDLQPFVSDARIPEGEQEFRLEVHGGSRWIEVRNRRLYTRAGAQASFADCRRAGQGAARAGSWSQTILILRDVTAHKQAEEERERGRRATALAEVAAMLAHEIRNPLASLELFAGLLAASPRLAQAPGAEREWIGHMRAGIRSLSGTMNNVLSFHGAGFPSLSPLRLIQAIESSVSFVRPIAEQAGVHLRFAGESGEIAVLGNASALQQLILNLVANAVRHTARGGQVTVSVRTVDLAAGRVELSVEDTGSGIRPEQLAEIFRPGFSAGGDSSGLGLAVCAQIVRQHQGTIRVASELGLGTTFYVELPTVCMP